MKTVIFTAYGLDVHTDFKIIHDAYTNKMNKIPTIKLWLMDEYVNLTEEDVKLLIEDLQERIKQIHRYHNNKVNKE